MPRYTHKTPSGTFARIIATDIEGDRSIAAAVPSRGDSEHVYCYRPQDLTPLPVKREGWINIYRNCSWCGEVYSTEEQALAAQHNVKVATIKIEWEEPA